MRVSIVKFEYSLVVAGGTVTIGLVWHAAGTSEQGLSTLVGWPHLPESQVLNVVGSSPDEVHE